MKRFVYIVFIYLFVFSNENLYSQTGELLLSQVNDGFFADVSIHIKRTSTETWKLGYASLVFNYNSSAMINPVEHLEGICDNETSSDYDDQIIVRYPGTNRLSIELGLTNDTAAGSEIPTDPVLLGVIRFEITSPIGLHNLTWDTDYSAITDENGNNITQNITFINPVEGLLPVELSGFSGEYKNGEVKLNWTTSSEINNYGFEIQRAKLESGNELSWIKTGFVNGKGSSSDLTNYTFKERNIQSGKYRYRLKQIDYNGNFEYFLLENEINIGIPIRYILHQNYPNPFNPVTVIRFEIPEEARVKISVYDITGKEVTSLTDDKYLPGVYEVKWDASSFAGGVYFYKITAGSFVQTKKIIYLK